MVFLWFRRPSLFPTQTFSLLMLALTPVEPVCFREFFQAPFPPFIASQKLNISSSRRSCGRNVYVFVLLRFWPTIKSRRTLSTVSGRKTFLCKAVSDPRSERNMVVVDSEQYLFIRTPHQRYSQCVSWRFKPLSLDDAHVAYVNHVVAALDLNQVFPNDLLFSFTVFWLIFTCILITALFSFSLASAYLLTSFRIILFSRRFPRRWTVSTTVSGVGEIIIM